MYIKLLPGHNRISKKTSDRKYKILGQDKYNATARTYKASDRTYTYVKGL